MVGLSAERQFELHAKKALETRDRSFKPRGAANKAAFAKMKEERGKQTNQINSHTTTEADRIIEETSRRVLETIGQRTQPLPDQITMAAKLSSQSTAVRVLDSILLDEGLECKGTKAEKAAVLAQSVPIHQLVDLLAEHAGTSMRASPSEAAPEQATKAPAKTAPPQQDSACDNLSNDHETPAPSGHDERMAEAGIAAVAQPSQAVDNRLS